jgi:hypothetical protein
MPLVGAAGNTLGWSISAKRQQIVVAGPRLLIYCCQVACVEVSFTVLSCIPVLLCGTVWPVLLCLARPCCCVHTNCSRLVWGRTDRLCCRRLQQRLGALPGLVACYWLGLSRSYFVSLSRTLGCFWSGRCMPYMWQQQCHVLQGSIVWFLVGEWCFLFHIVSHAWAAGLLRPCAQFVGGMQ